MRYSPETEAELLRISKIADPDERIEATIAAINEGARHLPTPYKLVREGDGFRVVPLSS
jgi:hypothetical protein